jgi:hypothetical protein
MKQQQYLFYNSLQCCFVQWLILRALLSVVQLLMGDEKLDKIWEGFGRKRSWPSLSGPRNFLAY